MEIDLFREVQKSIRSYESREAAENLEKQKSDPALD
jgi:hypothetical protein